MMANFPKKEILYLTKLALIQESAQISTERAIIGFDLKSKTLMKCSFVILGQMFIQVAIWDQVSLLLKSL